MEYFFIIVPSFIPLGVSQCPTREGRGFIIIIIHQSSPPPYTASQSRPHQIGKKSRLYKSSGLLKTQIPVCLRPQSLLYCCLNRRDPTGKALASSFLLIRSGVQLLAGPFRLGKETTVLLCYLLGLRNLTMCFVWLNLKDKGFIKACVLYSLLGPLNVFLSSLSSFDSC